MAYNRKGSRNKKTFSNKQSKTKDSLAEKDARLDKSESLRKGSSCNDWSWYVRTPQLVKDVASLNFNNALGAGYSLANDEILPTGLITGMSAKMPGICGIHTIPMMGYSGDPSSPINIASKNDYSFIRHDNSGHSNYESPDLMMYLCAMDSIYAYIMHLQRMYGTALVYSQRNRYVGDALLRIMGANPNDIRANLADFRAGINMLIVKASVYCTPRTMSLYDRHMWMYSGIYKDADIDKCQMYLYLPSILYTYDEMTIGDKKGGRLVATPILLQQSGGSLSRTTARTASWFINKGNELLAALQASEDISIMSGDILKAYGRENLNQMALIPESYMTMPIYSEEILDQIHNTIFIGGYPRAATLTDDNIGNCDLSSFNITQDTSDLLDPYIVCRPKVVNAPHLAIQHILDLGIDDPTPERVIVATRNMVSGSAWVYETAGGARTVYNIINTFGSDLCFFATVISDPVEYTGTNYYGQPINGLTPAMPDALVKFNRAPLIYGGVTNGDNWTATGACGSIDNFTIVDRSDLVKMHESAILSQFGVPV